MKQQKCPKCKEWNENVTHCSFCNEPLSAEVLNLEYRKKIEQEDAAKPQGKLFESFQKMKNSRYLATRILYQILFSIWSVYMFFVAVFTWFIATTVG